MSVYLAASLYVHGHITQSPVLHCDMYTQANYMYSDAGASWILQLLKLSDAAIHNTSHFLHSLPIFTSTHCCDSIGMDNTILVAHYKMHVQYREESCLVDDESLVGIPLITKFLFCFLLFGPS